LKTSEVWVWDAELDFIIHYDIKYRLGKQTSEVFKTSEV